MKLANKFRIVAAVLISLLVIIGETSCLALRKSEGELVSDSERRSGHKRRASAEGQLGRAVPLPKFNATNNTLSKSMFNDLNSTYVSQDLNTFRVNNRRWADLKLNDRQIEDIYQDLIYKQQPGITPEGSRAAIQIYVRQFEACDRDRDNVLSLKEFTGCMANDTYLSQITPPQIAFATYANYSFTNATGFYPILYNLMDTYRLNYTNFHDYMLLRLMVFSWRKCSVNGPYLDEVSFECAIDIATGTKTMTRNTARKLYTLALELSNTSNVRNIDFIAYYIIAQSARIYGKVNTKEDSDATRSEFTLALDGNVLPSRYNSDVVDYLFRLVGDADKTNQGIDIISFVFYDFFIRLFEVQNAASRWSLSKTEFTNLFNHYLFPAGTLFEVKGIPQNNLTANSYQMYTYLNVSVYHQEADHFLKFAQKNEKEMKAEGRLGVDSQMQLGKNFTFNLKTTSSWLFNILDHDGDGSISFLEYGNFIQISYLFSKFDPYKKGRIVAGDLFEKYTSYADFPYVSSTLRERAKRFNLFPQDLYFDLMRTVLVLRIDDIIKVNARRVDPTTLYEIELKKIFNSVNLGGVPDAYLNKCLRGVDDNNIPKYDWECAFVQAVTTTQQYLESSNFFNTVSNANLTLVNTAFVNVDPALK